MPAVRIKASKGSIFGPSGREPASDFRLGYRFVYEKCRAANKRKDVASSSQPISDRAASRGRYSVKKGVDAYRGLLMAFGSFEL